MLTNNSSLNLDMLARATILSGAMGIPFTEVSSFDWSNPCIPHSWRGTNPSGLWKLASATVNSTFNSYNSQSYMDPEDVLIVALMGLTQGVIKGKKELEAKSNLFYAIGAKEEIAAQILSDKIKPTDFARIIRRPLKHRAMNALRNRTMWNSLDSNISGDDDRTLHDKVAGTEESSDSVMINILTRKDDPIVQAFFEFVETNLILNLGNHTRVGFKDVSLCMELILNHLKNGKLPKTGDVYREFCAKYPHRAIAQGAWHVQAWQRSWILLYKVLEGTDLADQLLDLGNLSRLGDQDAHYEFNPNQVFGSRRNERPEWKEYMDKIKERNKTLRDQLGIRVDEVENDDSAIKLERTKKGPRQKGAFRDWTGAEDRNGVLSRTPWRDLSYSEITGCEII